MKQRMPRLDGHELNPTAALDTADYGGAEGDGYGPGPDEVHCRNCGALAINHTPARWSVYGRCPA